MKVAFLGLAKTHSPNNIRNSDELWTLNDFYRVYPQYKSPQRVYQIHGNFDPTALPGRYENWRAEYAKSQSEIVTINDMGFCNQRIFDKERAVSDFGKEFFVSTMSYMFADAIWQGVTEIFLEGINLIAGEFLKQVPGTIRNIEAARDHGIIVHAPKEDEWRTKLQKINWSNVRDFETPYWFDCVNVPQVIKHELSS